MVKDDFQQKSGSSRFFPIACISPRQAIFGAHDIRISQLEMLVTKIEPRLQTVYGVFYKKPGQVMLRDGYHYSNPSLIYSANLFRLQLKRIWGLCGAHREKL